MESRFATQSEITQWNKLLVSNPDGGNMFQSKEFLDIKSTSHWTPKFAVIDGLFISILERRIPLLGNFWYLPKGPGISNINEFKKILPSIKAFAASNKVFTVRTEPEIIKTAENTKKIQKMGLSTYFGIQVPNTIILDIQPDLESIEASFSSKTRYNIRAARKANITTEIVPINDQTCDIFYDMLNEVIHGRAALRSREYLKNFWQSHYVAGTGIFMFAKSGKRVVATDFIIILGKKGTRKDAASIRDNSVRGASALLEIEAIKYMKEIGVTTYDLCGSPPSDRIKDPTHPYYGFGSFKLGFSPDVTDFIGSCDLPINQNAYKIWRRIGERIAHRAYRYIYHEVFY